MDEQSGETEEEEVVAW